MKNKASTLAYLGIIFLASSALAGSELQDCANSSLAFTNYKACLKDKYKSRGLSDAVAGNMSERASNLDFCAMRLQLPDRVPVAPSNPLYPTYDACMQGSPVPDAQVAAAAAMPSKCQDACKMAADNTKFSTGDPKCDRDPACKACVQGKQGGQLGSYCTANGVTKKGKTSQGISTAVYTAVGTACLIGCIPGYGQAAGQAACTAGGFVALASDLLLGKSMTQLDSYSKGWVKSVTSVGKPVVQGLSLVTGGTSAIAGIVKSMGVNSANLACASAALYYIQAGLKVASIVKFNKSQSKNCDDIEKFLQPTNASPLIAECKKNTIIPPAHEGAPGVMSSVPKTFNVKDPEIAQIIQDDPNLKGFFERVEKDPKLLDEVNKVGQKVLEDQSVEGVLADLGSRFPNAPVDGLLEMYDRAKNGETLTALNMSGADTKAVLAGGENHGGNVAENGISSELKFGSGNDVVTPQEGANSLEVGRAPANAVTNINSSDPFHAGDSRDLFRIASDQIKNQVGKKNVQALAPDSRMNRMLSGMRASDHEAK